MDRLKFRKRKVISYYEPEEPSFDEYIYCENCYDFVFEYCAIHGPLLVIPDNEVKSRAGIPPWVPRAALTTPMQFVHIAPSIIPDAGLGVFSSVTLPRGVRFGPYRGKRTDNINSSYCWKIRIDNKYSVVDGMDGESSNWMRYVNCARTWHEQNLVAFQYQGKMYYRTVKIIPKFTELMIFYGSEHAHALGIDLKTYNDAKKIEVDKYIIEDHSPEYTETNNDQMPIFNTEVLEICEETPKGNTEQGIYKESTVLTKQAYSNTVYTNTTNIDKQNIDTQLKIDSNNKICDVCDKIVHLHSYKRHRRIHEKESFFCSLCSYKTNFSGRFNIHMNNHTKDEIYECDSCTYVTYNRVYFRRHYKTIHKIVLSALDKLDRYNKNVVTGKSFYNCLKCNFKTNFKINLICHLDTHTIYKDKYQCDSCSYVTTVRKYFLRHIRTVHYKANNLQIKSKVYQCDLCTYISNVRFCFVRHFKRIHERKYVH